jgi:hypothetical protein
MNEKIQVAETLLEIAGRVRPARWSHKVMITILKTYSRYGAFMDSLLWELVREIIQLRQERHDLRNKLQVEIYKRRGIIT